MSVHSRLHTNEYLRDKYLSDNEVCYGLLDTFRNVDVGNVYVVDGKIKQVVGNPGGTLRPLTSEELQARWLLLVNNVRTHTRRHFKHSQYAQQGFNGMKVEWYHVPQLPQHMADVLNGFYTSQNNVGRWERQLDRVHMLVQYIQMFPRTTPSGKQHNMNMIMANLGWKYVYLDVLRQYRTQGYSAKQPEDEGKPEIDWVLVKFCPTAEKYLQGTFDIEVAIERYTQALLDKWNTWADLYRKGKKTAKQEPQYPTANCVDIFRRKMAVYLRMKESTIVTRISLEHLEEYPPEIQSKVHDAFVRYDEETVDLLNPE